MIEERFAHLTIHYSSRKDSPTESNPQRPYVVVNENTKQAYWVSKLIEPYIKQYKFDWYTHDDEAKLRAWLRTQKVNLNQNKPSPEDLGLWLTAYGTLMPLHNPLNLEAIHKFRQQKNNGKFNDLQIAFIFPWYTYFSRSLFNRSFPPDKRLLLNFTTHVANSLPPSHLQLYREEILPSDTYTRFPLEPLWFWCWRQSPERFHLDKKHVNENELLALWQQKAGIKYDYKNSQ